MLSSLGSGLNVITGVATLFFTVTDTGVLAATVELSFLRDLTVMVVVPVATPVTIPFASTVAIAVLADSYVVCSS